MKQSKKILITGGAGYVGSHCCKAFAEAGWNVTVFDNLSRGWRGFVKWGELIKGDVRDSDAIRKALKQVKPDAVVHFAALTYVGESMETPGLYFENNVAGSANLLWAMHEADVGQIVFSSTCAVYGNPVELPITEDHPLQPISPYGWSKLFVEQMLQKFDEAYGIKSVSLRYFNAAGADPDGKIGERHEPETHLIPLVIQSAYHSDQQLQINGNDFDTPDGTCIRDYIHVSDLASAHLAALRYLETTQTSDKFNLGTGEGISVKEMIAIVEELSQRRVKWELGPRRFGDLPVLIASPKRANDVLGWVPERSSINQIIKDALSWHGR